LYNITIGKDRPPLVVHQ